MKKTKTISLAVIAYTTLCAVAQDGMRMPDPYERLSKREKTALQKQASSIFSAAEPVVKDAAKSTVSIYVLGKRVAFGTAVRTKDSKVAVLTKWSEIAKPRGPLSILSADGKSYTCKVAGVYPEQDLALISTNAPLTPLNLVNAAQFTLGSFLALARPDGKVEGIGVVSVLSRSLREKDKAYLGVMMDFSKAGKKGVPLQRVMPDSAAIKAGLRNGDVVVAVDKTPITGAMEMRNLLQRLEPGSEVVIRYRRGDEEKDTTVHLGSRADNADIRRVPRERMERMQRMGTSINPVRDNFPNVIQSDLAVDRNDMGAPVINLDGKVVGITIARGSRIKTFITPASTLVRMLAFDPTPVDQAFTMRQPGSQIPQAKTDERTSRTSSPDADPASRVRDVLGEIEKNNQLNQDILREVEERLRNIERKKQNR